MALLGIVYVLFTRRNRLSVLAQGPGVAKLVRIFRFVLGGTAVLAFVASIFPRESPEAGILLYGVLWPLLGLQFASAYLPWEKFFQKSPAVTTAGAGIVGFYTFSVVFLMLRLTSYV